MDHIAILKYKGKYLEKIGSGEKTIESRWSINKISPYKKVSVGEIIYFKESGRPVTKKAKVAKVLYFEALNFKKIKFILEEYGSDICISEEDSKNLTNKRYCSLFFLDDVQEVTPFSIDKTGFGLMSAWLCIKNIKQIRR
jgi:ASC-1-like (ASCH) protein